MNTKREMPSFTGFPSPTPFYEAEQERQQQSRSVAGKCEDAKSPPPEKRVAEFNEAAEKLRHKFIWIAMRISNRPQEAEDIVQTALLKAFANLGRFREESRMSTWLSAIVQNTARDFHRKERGKTFISLDTPLDPDSDDRAFEIPCHRLSLEEYVEEQERAALVLAARNQMNPMLEDVLRLCIMEETPYAQVATTLNVHISTVKSRVLRGKRALKKALFECGGLYE